MRDTDKLEAMEPREYVIDETFRRIKNNRLLDSEGAGINSALTEPSELALAGIADAVHKHARHLTPDQAELAVQWLKKWKLSDSVPEAFNSMQATDAFEQKLETLKNSPEQVRLQAVALRHAFWARVWGVGFAVSLALLVGLGMSGGGSWFWWALALAALVGSFVASERALSRALVTAKEQDRKYALESIRAANTVSELLNAGLCSYIPGVLYEGPNYDERYAKEQMAKERARLADALYLDPEGYLDPYSYRDPGPRV